MIEKIRKLKIKGGKFEKETPFEFFKNENQRVAIVYGRNGSGKSTIAKGFREFMKADLEMDGSEDYIGKEVRIDLFDESNNNLNNDIKDKVVVFDEEYVNENIGFVKKDGLRTITLIGAQNKKQKEIDEISKEVEIVEKQRIEVTNKLKLCSENKKNFELQCDVVLSCGGNNWRDRRKKISDKFINNNRIERDKVLRTEVVEEKRVIDLQYSELVERYSKAKGKGIYLNKVNDGFICINFDEEMVKRLISKEVEKPMENSELDQIINENFSFIDISKKIFENKKYCPYCYQKIDEEYKERVLKVIGNIQNKEVEKYQRELNNIQIRKIEIEGVNDYIQISTPDLINRLKLLIYDCNSSIDQYNAAIVERINNPYKKIESHIINNLIEKFENINKCVCAIKNLIKNINDIIENLNNDKTKLESLQAELLELNDKKGNLEIFEYGKCNQYFRSYKEYEDNEKELIRLNKEVIEIDDELKKYRNKIAILESEKLNCKVACDKMNEYLSYIQFSKRKITIDIDNNNYILKIDGKNVTPNRVSTGERNIIALCYFFLDAMDGNKEDELYKIERLYIIDDPVSSFDYENRIGIMSFLRMQYNKILNGEEHGRLLIFSHDISTIRDTIKCIKDIYNNDADKKYKLFELRNAVLGTFKYEENVYNKLLNDIYNYASDDKKVDEDQSIGNKMRRVLEAFSTFIYRKGIEEVSTNEEIIKDVENHDFYKNLMYRLILHGESHFEDESKNIGGTNSSFEYLEENSKKITARCVLCLMHLLNPKHIKFQLYNKADGNRAEEKLEEKINTIVKWEKENKDIYEKL